MKREKQYQIRLTESEDKLLKQVARKTGISVADVIQLGIKYQIQDLENLKYRQIQEESELLKNWERYFGESMSQEFGVIRQASLQGAYLKILMGYKDSVCYTNGNFEIIPSIPEVENISSASSVNEETPPEGMSEQEVKEEICQCLTSFLGGEWNGEEGIVSIFLNGLKTDLLHR
jgi:predicted DNA-binding protein